jgi:hypothetical protein
LIQFCADQHLACSFENTVRRIAALEIASASNHQVEDQNDQRQDQQQMNQATGNMKTEAKEPQNQNDDKNCPEHRYLSCIPRASET